MFGEGGIEQIESVSVAVVFYDGAELNAGVNFFAKFLQVVLNRGG